MAFASRGVQAPVLLAKLAAAGFAGRKNRRGFYAYPAPGEKKRKGPKQVNPEILSFLGQVPMELPKNEIQDRVALMMVNEAVHCLADGIIASPRDGDAGAILGLGFPPFRGGPFHYIDSMGALTIVNRLRELQSKYNARFTPRAFA